MHASRSEQAPHYQQREIGLFKLLSPHVCRVLAISDALDIRALRSEMLERTLDGLVAGVFLTARDGRVVYMNAAAERQIKTGNSIRIVNNRLSPTDPAARAALSKAIDEAARDDVDKDMQRTFAGDPGCRRRPRLCRDPPSGRARSAPRRPRAVCGIGRRVHEGSGCRRR